MQYNLVSTIVPAIIADYPLVQNMARFYVYDLSRHCGFISKEWAMPTDGLYECFDFKSYFEENDKKAYLIKVDDELAGFVLIDKDVTSQEAEWNMGEFFVLAKFQGKGISSQVAYQIWNKYQGTWEVRVIPQNSPALSFWRKAIINFTKNNYLEEIKDIKYDPDQPKRVIFNFDTR